MQDFAFPASTAPNNFPASAPATTTGMPTSAEVILTSDFTAGADWGLELDDVTFTNIAYRNMPAGVQTGGTPYLMTDLGPSGTTAGQTPKFQLYGDGATPAGRVRLYYGDEGSGGGLPDVGTPGRFMVAFDASALTWDASFTALDAYPNLVTSYTIDRGRQYELDRTDIGRAVVEIADQDGILDPTNPDGPFHGKIQPLLQAMIRRQNPVTGEWHVRFRGFIEDYNYDFHPSQRVNMLTLSLVDLFEVLAAIEMHPGDFGDPPPADAPGDAVFFDDDLQPRDRMNQVLANAGIPAAYIVLFSGNVQLFATTYSAGENVLTVMEEAADAEFPGVGNVYVDRKGRVCFHGRLAKFTPAEIAAEAGPDRWDYQNWTAGDGAATGAHLRRFGFNRGLSKIINYGSATPLFTTDYHQLTAAQTNGQIAKDGTSILKYGTRSWSAQNLLTKNGNLDEVDSLVETKRFAQYYVANYKDPQNRITDIAFRSMRPDLDRAAETWELICRVDVADSVDVTVSSPGGGGFASEGFFVEGVHEECRPAAPDIDDVTVTLDLSPRAYYTTNPWP